ncbi:Mu transposase C-terminal domain-containing protein [Ralstonia pseudosolanacearum]|uniref:Mu transposase C-terminal domain-containing protein n=1 Tax=Ralstonia pseudosolanacearum TaxID=1310165 RepID=UPI003AAE9355
MSDSAALTEREIEIARVLHPLGTKPMTRSQAAMAARLLGVHWTTIYRLRQRFLQNPVASSLVAGKRGRLNEPHRLETPVEAIVQDVVEHWLPQQRHLAHPILDSHVEIRRRCAKLGLSAPSRSTVSRRIQASHKAELLRSATDPAAAIAPGNFGAARPLDIVQIDHTQADVLVVDRFSRRVIGRPWLSVAIDLATRCVVAFFLGMERPSAATVALLVSRIVLPKGNWLASLELNFDWPMNGLPKVLHMDNAAEFHSRALRLGCAQYGIALQYRPVGKPQFGGHVERMNRTLMDRLRGLPGTTGNSPKGRKQRKSEQQACLTLSEFERWLALEIGQRYHHSQHRGLFGATPHGCWVQKIIDTPTRQIEQGPDAALRLLMDFMPVARRTIQRDGLTIFHIRYWHPVFTVWRDDRRVVRVRYHPEDLSRVYVSADGHHYVEARYADLRRPSITLWEQRAAVRWLREKDHLRLSEALLFKAIEQQREIVQRATHRTRLARANMPLRNTDPSVGAESSGLNYANKVAAFPVEIW